MSIEAVIERASLVVLFAAAALLCSTALDGGKSKNEKKWMRKKTFQCEEKSTSDKLDPLVNGKKQVCKMCTETDW